MRKIQHSKNGRNSRSGWNRSRGERDSKRQGVRPPRPKPGQNGDR